MADSFDNKMTGKAAIILGSARSDGYMAQMATRIASRLEVNLIDLKAYQIGHYNCQHK